MPDAVRPQVDARMYARVFEGHAEAALILEDLVARFYDKASYVRGGPEGARQTDYNEGRRSVVAHILAQLGQIQQGDHNADS